MAVKTATRRQYPISDHRNDPELRVVTCRVCGHSLVTTVAHIFQVRSAFIRAHKCEG